MGIKNTISGPTWILLDDVVQSYQRGFAPTTPPSLPLTPAGPGDAAFTEYPNFTDAHGFRALGLSRDGRWEEFAGANHRGAQLTGMHPIYRARKALGLRKTGRIDGAQEIVSEVGEADLSTLSKVRAVAALAAGDDDLALKEPSVAIREHQLMPMWIHVGKFFDESDPRVQECFAPLLALAMG